MRVEDLTINLRPRGPWEAIDLGMQMTRHWAGAIYLPWLIVYFSLAGVLVLLLPDNLSVVALILWWLKPVYDRLMLFILSRAVFGQVPSAWQTLTSPGQWLRTGLPMALTLARLNPARAFHLAIRQLEGLSGAKASRRRQTLNAQAHGHAMGLTFVWIHLEMIIWISVLGLGFLLVPSQLDFDWMGFWFEDDYGLVEPLILIAQLSATALLEPFYVGGGFALYLNRRSELEGWDLELAFRRMNNRLQGKSLAKGLAAGIAAIAITLGSPAVEAKSIYKETIENILAEDEFKDHKTVTTWVRTSPEEENDWGLDWDFDWLRGLSGLEDLIFWLAESGRILIWLFVVLGIILIIRNRDRIARLLGRMEAPKAPHKTPPATIAGLDIRPESLPDDIAAAARAALKDGNPRAALSLLYRGSVSALVHRFKLSLRSSDTEGDVLRVTTAQSPAPQQHYMSVLTQAWERAAYAHQQPAEAEILKLCDDWTAIFSGSGKVKPS